MSFSGQRSKTQPTGSRTEERENESEGNGRGGKERINSEDREKEMVREKAN